MAAEACVGQTINYLVILSVSGILYLHQRPRETPSHGSWSSAQLRHSRPTMGLAAWEEESAPMIPPPFSGVLVWFQLSSWPLGRPVWALCAGLAHLAHSQSPGARHPL